MGTWSNSRPRGQLLNADQKVGLAVKSYRKAYQLSRGPAPPCPHGTGLSRSLVLKNGMAARLQRWSSTPQW